MKSFAGTLLALGALTMTACDRTLATGEPKAGSDLRPVGELPDGAIATGDNFYMVPIVEDAGGCMQYRPFSPGLLTPAVIYYRRADGSFTLNRAETDCPPLETNKG